MSGFEVQQTVQEAEAAAILKGCVCVRPAMNQLFIDLDSQDAIDQFNRLILSFMAQEPATYTFRPSPSGRRGRAHVVVTLERVITSELERIMLQAVLGSDPMRELLNWRRLASGVPHEANNLLFELKP